MAVVSIKLRIDSVSSAALRSECISEIQKLIGSGALERADTSAASHGSATFSVRADRWTCAKIIFEVKNYFTYRINTDNRASKRILFFSRLCIDSQLEKMPLRRTTGMTITIGQDEGYAPEVAIDRLHNANIDDIIERHTAPMRAEIVRLNHKLDQVLEIHKEAMHNLNGRIRQLESQAESLQGQLADTRAEYALYRQQHP